MSRFCIDCNKDISGRHGNATLCDNCAYERQLKHHKNYWNKNKDRYQYRWIKRLGTTQDKEILELIRKKREGEKTPNYKPLSDYQFKYSNHAYVPRYRDKIISGEYYDE